MLFIPSYFLGHRNNWLSLTLADLPLPETQTKGCGLLAEPIQLLGQLSLKKLLKDFNRKMIYQNFSKITRDTLISIGMVSIVSYFLQSNVMRTLSHHDLSSSKNLS